MYISISILINICIQKVPVPCIRVCVYICVWTCICAYYYILCVCVYVCMRVYMCRHAYKCIFWCLLVEELSHPTLKLFRYYGNIDSIFATVSMTTATILHRMQLCIVYFTLFISSIPNSKPCVPLFRKSRDLTFVI